MPGPDPPQRDPLIPLAQAAVEWLEANLNGDRPVGFPWESLTAFLRISTHPRAGRVPLSPADAWSFVDDWLGSDVAWIPRPGSRHREVLTDLITRYELRGNLVSDAHLAAIAMQHGLAVVSSDTDFALFKEVTWVNPLA